MKKLFGTDGVRGEFGKFPMDLETVFRLGKAAGKCLGKKCLIGRDTRKSGAEIEKELVKGLTLSGVDVYSSGIMTTPGISWLTQELGMEFGAVISASHNPYQDNGIKFFGKNGLKLKDEIEEEIEKLVFSDGDAGGKKGRAKKMIDAREKYIEFVKGTINNISLKGTKIVLDCANGAAYQMAPRIFSELGAEVIAVNNSPDGKNINAGCGAVYPEFLKDKVWEFKADIGITLDGDGDRVILLDEKGNIIDGDFILAIAGIDLKEKGLLKNNLIVATVMANGGLEECLKKYGIKLLKARVGDRYVSEEMVKGGYVLGGEQSGHIIFSEHARTGDGILSALQILKIMKEKRKKLSELSSAMEKYPQALINVGVREKKEISKMISVAEKIKEIESNLNKPNNKGRVLVRYSGTQNLLRVMVEGRNKELVENYAQEIAEEIKKEVGV